MIGRHASPDRQLLRFHRALGRALAALLAIAIIPRSHGASEPAAPPEIERIEPFALRQGITNHVRVRGRNLTGITGLWTTWRGATRFQTPPDSADDAATVRLPILVPPRLSSGVEMMRLITSNGVSNPFLLLIDRLPATNAGRDNNQIKTALPLEAPAAIDTVFRESQLQYFKIHLPAGRRLAIEAVANRIGSNADPVLRLLDPDGRELRYVNDTPGMGSDCALIIRAPAHSAADYIIELRDAEYAGGERYYGRLRLGPFPVAVLPGFTPDTPEDRIAWESALSGQHGTARLVPPRRRAPAINRMWFGGTNRIHALTPRLTSRLRPTHFESEPNSDRMSGNPAAANAIIKGAFATAGDQDWFKLELSQPGRWRFEARSRTLGWPCDPLIRLLDGEGHTIAIADTASLDTVIYHQFEKPGTYHVVLEELTGAGGPGHGYIVTFHSAAAGFELSTESDRLNVTPGGKEVLKLSIDRRKWNGPIQLVAPGLTKGFSMANPVIPAGKKDWDLEIHVEKDIAPGKWCHTAIEGRPADEPDAETVPLDLRPAWRKSFPRRLTLPHGFADEIWICAVAPPPESSK